MAKNSVKRSVRKRVNAVREVVTVPTVLASHIRFAVVLRLLEAYADDDSGDAARSRRSSGTKSMSEFIADADTLELAVLFENAPQAQDERDVRGHTERIPRGGWSSAEAWQGPIGFKTVYELQPFYGLAAPNNAANRFERMLSGLSEHAARSARRGGRKATDREPRRGEYDERIEEWGRYAENLVAANDGWSEFVGKLRSRAGVVDVWPQRGNGSVSQGQGPEWPGDEQADAPVIGELTKSFIRRLLAVLKDRYVQLVASPVGVLWPLWALMDAENWRRLGVLDEPHPRAGKNAVGATPPALRHLCIDFNTHVGMMAGLPFPFGCADWALQKAFQRRHGANADAMAEHRDQPWPAAVVNLIAESIGRKTWSPPLLFPGRGGQWRDLSHVAEFIAIAEPVNFFASVFCKRGRVQSKERLKKHKLKVAYEAESLAARELERRAKWDLQRKQRTDMVGGFLDSPERLDVVVSSFPNDVLLRTNTLYQRLSLGDTFDEFGDAFVLGRTVLAGSAHLAREPRMARLILQVGGIISKIAAVCERLCPPRELLAESLRNVREGEFSEVRRHVVELRTRLEMFEEMLEKTPRNRLRPNGFRQTTHEGARPASETEPEYIAKGILQLMGSSMFCQRRAQIEQFKEAVDGWAWALLLEYLWCTTVFYSDALFASAEK